MLACPCIRCQAIRDAWTWRAPPEGRPGCITHLRTLYHMYLYLLRHCSIVRTLNLCLLTVRAMVIIARLHQLRVARRDHCRARQASRVITML